MPRKDGTGPRGMGAMTGKGAGFCTGATAVPEFGLMGGLGGRQGAGNLWCGKRFGRQVPLMVQREGDPGQGKELLANQIGMMERQLQQAKQRLESLSSNLK